MNELKKTKFVSVSILLILISYNLYSQQGKSHTTITNDGAWCWFSDPRAVYYKGHHKRTYSAWVTKEGNICAGMYDHKKKETLISTVVENFEKDDHNNPAVYITPEGYIWLLFSKHATPEPIWVYKSTKPEDISEWQKPETLSLNDVDAYQGYRDSYTYVNLCKLRNENNKMFIFWRGMDFKPNVSVSRDMGTNWSKGKILILPERIYQQRRPYIKFYGNNIDKIHFAFTDGHPRREPTNSIYYMYYANGYVFKANGDTIKNWENIPVDPEEADVVYNASETRQKAWIWDVAENENGNPVVAYATFPDDNNHIYHYSYFTGGKWVNLELLNSGPWFPHTPEGRNEPEPNYSGGISIDKENPEIVYLSCKINDVFEIQKWTKNDDDTWEIEKITTGSENDNVRPYAILGAGPKVDRQVMWMNINDYVHYTDYDASIKIK